jgi:hypothetical protein
MDMKVENSRAENSKITTILIFMFRSLPPLDALSMGLISTSAVASYFKFFKGCSIVLDWFGF